MSRRRCDLAPLLPMTGEAMSPEDRRLVIYCLLHPSAAEALEDLRAHYRVTDPRVQAIVDRRVAQRRRPLAEVTQDVERRTGTDRRRFAVPRRLAPLPPELAARTGPVKWIQRMLPVAAATDTVEPADIVAAVRAGDAEAPTELYWRAYQRMYSRLSVLLHDPREVDAAVARAFGRVLDALEDPERRDQPFDELLYDEVDAAAREGQERGGEAHGVPHLGLEVTDRALDEPVRVYEPDPLWPARARSERDAVLATAGTAVAAVEHVGGTALPKVPGRDTIDLLVGVRGAPDEHAAAIAALVAAGFEDCGDAGAPGRRYLRRRGDEPVDLHVVEHGGALWDDAIALRDWLLRNGAEAERWGAVRRAAARCAPDSAMRYQDVRRLTLEELVEQARAAALPRAA